MGRPGKPWWDAERREWRAVIGGKRRRLNVTDPNALEAAQNAYDTLRQQIAALVVSTGTPKSVRLVASAVCDFLTFKDGEEKAGHISPAATHNYRMSLGVFSARFGDRDVSGLTAQEIELWADHHRDKRGRAWSDSTKNSHLGSVQTLLKWCGSPVKLVRPPKESRGADTCLTDEQFAKVLAAMPDGRPGGRGDLRELLVALRETGARPQELAGLTVEAVDWGAGCVRQKKHKTRRKTGRDRVIYFNAAAREILERQRAKYSGAGLLFRTKFGRRYSANEIVRRLREVSKKVGFRCIAYGQRHAFATNALAAGVPDAVLAELLGHTSTDMVTRNYGHLNQRSQVLRDAAEKASTKKAG